jgi:hypothetical protein
MKKYKIILLIASMFVLIRCNNEQPYFAQEFNTAANRSFPTKDDLKYRKKVREAIETGDTDLYDEAAGYFIIKSNSKEEFYYFSLMMANKHNYSGAYRDMFMILSHPNSGINIEKLDPRTQRLAKYYLLKALELSHDTSLVDGVFPRNSIPLKKEFNKLE